MHIPFSNTVNTMQSIINKTRSRKENAKAKRKVKETRCESCYRRNEKRCLLLGALHLLVLCAIWHSGEIRIYIQIYVNIIMEHGVWQQCNLSPNHPKKTQCLLHPLEAFNSTSNRHKQIPKLILWSLFKYSGDCCACCYWRCCWLSWVSGALPNVQHVPVPLLLVASSASLPSSSTCQGCRLFATTWPTLAVCQIYDSTAWHRGRPLLQRQLESLPTYIVYKSLTQMLRLNNAQSILRLAHKS